jgi:alpha-tubulin suppressor-like RCC1 family protein
VYLAANSEIKHEACEVEFVDCAVGNHHFLAVARDGRLFSWGRGKPCGQGRKYRCDIPKPVRGFERTAKVVAYAEISFMINFESIPGSCAVSGSGDSYWSWR